MKKNLLLLSSSRVADTGFLVHALSWIDHFLNKLINEKPSTLLFIPYAGISLDFERYTQLLNQALSKINIKTLSIHEIKDKTQALKQCQGVIVGGGNTFSLLNSLYQHQLVEPLNKVVEAGTPYIGWSAGSNIAAPTIKTTNDMPIVQPPSFDALGLLSWQINPHYIDTTPPGHRGETRQQRIEEFLIANPKQKVIGIPEGTALHYQNQQLSYLGDYDGYLFQQNKKEAFNSQTNINLLLE